MTKTNAMTRKDAIIIAMKAIEDAGDTPELVAAHEILDNMLTQLSKPRKAVVSKARIMNQNIAGKVVERMPETGVTTKDVVAMGFPEILTPQKASAVLRVACEMGLARKVTEGKKVTYLPVTEDTPED